MPSGQSQRVLQVGALHQVGLHAGQLGLGERHGVPPEADDLQRVLGEPGGHQMGQRERGLLHRPPASLRDHREGQVDAQRHGRGSAPLGLHHLEVLDRERHRRQRTGPPDRVAHRAHHVEGLLVAVLEASRRTGDLPGRAGAVQVVLSAPARFEVREHVPQRGTAEPAQRLRRQCQPVRAAGQPALPAQFTLQFPQPAHVVGSPPAELALHRLYVDVVQGRARVLLAQLVDEVVEVTDLLKRTGGVAVPERLVAVYPLAPAPLPEP